MEISNIYPYCTGVGLHINSPQHTKGFSVSDLVLITRGQDLNSNQTVGLNVLFEGHTFCLNENFQSCTSISHKNPYTLCFIVVVLYFHFNNLEEKKSFLYFLSLLYNSYRHSCIETEDITLIQVSLQYACCKPNQT